MSRCYCCNKIMSKQELSRKFSVSGEYIEMCTECLNTIDASYEDGEHLEDDEDNYEDE